MAHYETNPVLIIITGFKQAFNKSQQLAIMLIVVPMILGVVSFVGQIFGEVFGAVTDTGKDNSPVLVAIGVVLFFLMILLQIFIQTLFTGFQGFAMYKFSRGEDETFGVAMSHAFSKFWKIFGVTFMTFIYSLPYAVVLSVLVTGVVISSIAGDFSYSDFIVIGVSVVPFVALVVLMIRVYMRYAFASYYVFAGAESSSVALDRSKELTKGRLSEVFGVITIGSLVPIVQTLSMIAGMSVLLTQLTQARKSKAVLPKPHILNFLVPALAFFFIVFVVFVIVAIIYATSSNNL